MKRSLPDKEDAMQKKKKRKMILNQNNKCDSKPVVIKQEKMDDDFKKSSSNIPGPFYQIYYFLLVNLLPLTVRTLSPLSPRYRVPELKIHTILPPKRKKYKTSIHLFLKLSLISLKERLTSRYTKLLISCI